MAKRVTGVTTKRVSDQDTDGGMRLGEDDRAGTVGRLRGSTARSVPSTKREPTVNTPSAAWEFMKPKWDLIDTLLAGTAAMRAAGKTYLPQHQYESDDAYDERLGRAVLRNYVSGTLEKLVGKALKDPPALADGAPQLLEDFCTDVDGEGNALAVFARSWFRAGVQKAFAWVLIDYTATAEPRAEGEVRTLADDEAEGARPFWRLIDSSDLIEVRGRFAKGKLTLDRVRIRECTVEPSGDWGEEIVHRVRVLLPGAYELWRLVEVKNKKEKWAKEEAGPMDLDYIPLVPFYTAKDGLMEGKPHLEDLAYLNVEHWQSSTDQRTALTVGRFPILAASGVTDAEGNGPGANLVVGPKKFLTTPDPQSKIYYVEHGGAALSAGKDDLKDLEDAMAAYGAQFLRQRTGDTTATGRALDGAEAISELQAMGIDFKDSLERALQITCDWLGIEAEGDKAPEVNFEVGAEVKVGEAADLSALKDARSGKDISRVAYLRELQRRDVLGEEFDAEEDQALIDAEPPPPGGLEGLMPRPNGLPSKQTPAVPGQKPAKQPAAKDPPIQE